MSAIQNYKVLAYQFGSYSCGAVIPRYVAAEGNNLDELVATGVIAPTNDPVNVDLVPPRRYEAPSPEAEAAAQLINDLRAKLAVAESDRDVAVGRAAEAERQRDALKAELPAHITEVDRLRKALDAVTAERDELRVELDHLTKPTG